MVFNWNGLRLSAGAAALAMALVAGSPVQAKMYKFTMSGVQQDGSTITGSVNVDSTPVYAFSSYYDPYGNFGRLSYAITNRSGFFTPSYTNDGSGNVFSIFYAERGTPSTVEINTNSQQQNAHSGFTEYKSLSGEYNPVSMFTSDALTSGLYNEFKSGTYALSNPEGYSATYSYDLPNYDNGSQTGGELNLASLSLKMAPAAPAPLVGGGLLSALAALLGLGMTRLGRRRDVLA